MRLHYQLLNCKVAIRLVKNIDKCQAHAQCPVLFKFDTGRISLILFAFHDMPLYAYHGRFRHQKLL